MVDGSRFDDLTRALGKKSTRRRALVGIAGVVTGGLFARQASARTLTVCHATGDAEAPYESLEVSQAEFNLHARHGDYLRVECCADGDCASLDSVCGSGVCQNGYCVQLPEPAGTPCGDGLYCNGQATCDGAFSCVAGDPIVCPASSNPCSTIACDEAAQGCVETTNAGDACTADEQHDGICDEQAICQPKLVCTDPPTCGEGQCAPGQDCVNGTCFTSCTSDDDCLFDCGEKCECGATCDNSEGPRYCGVVEFSLGTAKTNDGCPSGTMCSAMWGIYSTDTGWDGYCLSSCQRKE